MTDTQLLTLAIAIIVPLSMLLYSNSRITEAKETLRADTKRVEDTLHADLGRVEGVLRAEINGISSELKAVMMQLNNKLDHIIETQADHSNRLEKLENR